MYTTKIIIKDASEIATPVIMNHESMAQLVEYLKFHNLVLGEPRVNTPYVKVEHADGSSLNSDELEIVASESSREKYGERIREVPSSAPTDPETGERHSEVAKAMKRK